MTDERTYWGHKSRKGSGQTRKKPGIHQKYRAFMLGCLVVQIPDTQVQIRGKGEP